MSIFTALLAFSLSASAEEPSAEDLARSYAAACERGSRSTRCEEYITGAIRDPAQQGRVRRACEADEAACEAAWLQWSQGIVDIRSEDPDPPPQPEPARKAPPQPIVIHVAATVPNPPPQTLVIKEVVEAPAPTVAPVDPCLHYWSADGNMHLGLASGGCLPQVSLEDSREAILYNDRPQPGHVRAEDNAAEMDVAANTAYIVQVQSGHALTGWWRSKPGAGDAPKLVQVLEMPTALVSSLAYRFVTPDGRNKLMVEDGIPTVSALVGTDVARFELPSGSGRVTIHRLIRVKDGVYRYAGSWSSTYRGYFELYLPSLDVH